MRCTRDYTIKPVERFKENRRFDLRDNKGRQIGINLRVDSADFKVSENGNGYELSQPGEWFLCYAHASRDGVSYGASNGTHFEPSLADAVAWCEGRAKSTEASYRRKFK